MILGPCEQITFFGPNPLLKLPQRLNFHGVEKLEAVCCLSARFMVTQDTVRPPKKENISRQNKKVEGTNGPDPLVLTHPLIEPLMVQGWLQVLILCLDLLRLRLAKQGEHYHLG